MNTGENHSVETWDISQMRVIESDRSVRLIVDAGPGTGKTAVSCARLANLVHVQGVQPSKCWMISFTRTAVAEIRARLYGYLGVDSFSVKVATIDSQAWAIHSGFDSTASLTGSYEQNIADVLKLVTEDPEVQEYLEGIEHLILDEAQDFVANRADLICAILKALDPTAGVTVFADEAQAIYGFAERQLKEEGGESLLDSLRRSKTLDFSTMELDTVHRTKSAGLLRIFRDVRKLLTKENLQPGVFDSIQAGIFAHADSNVLANSELAIEDLPAGLLLLFRKRSEALEKSQYAQAPHSLRLQGYGVNLPAWLSLCFWDYQQSHIDKSAFAKRWLERVEKFCPPEYGMEEAWERLLRAGGTGDGAIELKLLRTRLGKHSPPVELTNRDFGLPGPIIGTIHASKGREADDVILLVQKEPQFQSALTEAEEARVLFVGSTRARSTLRVGRTSNWTGTKTDTDRAFRRLRTNYKAMIEIGRPEDLLSAGLVGISAFSQSEALTAQSWLQNRAGVMIIGLNIKSDHKRENLFQLFDPESDVLLGWLTSRFRDDMRRVAGAIAAKAGGKFSPPSRVAYVKAYGCRSIVLPPDDSQLSQLHTPWAQTGFLLAPRVASFTSAAFWKAK